MKTTPSRYIVSIVSLMIFLLSGQAGVQGYVLCLGENGHAALEYVDVSGCGAGEQQGHQDCQEENRDLHSHEEHCGPCLDLPASLEAASRRTQDHEDLTAQAWFPSALQVSPLPTFIRILTASLYPQPPPRVSQTILAHRTVVLLN
jgi:hypothetical protein